MIKFFIGQYKELKRGVASINWGNSWEEEEKYLLKISDNFKHIGNGIDASRMQYRCQMFWVPWWKRLQLQFFCFISFLLVLLKILFRTLLHKKIDRLQADVAYFYSEAIFSERMKSGKKLIYIPELAFFIKLTDLIFLTKIAFKSRFNFVILSSTVYRLGQIRYAYECYGIREVWATMEYACSCGIMYEYCEKLGLKLKNFMHGEKVLTLRDAFVQFHEFYVWDEHYANLFRRLKANAKIIIDNPWVLEKKEKSQNRSGKVCYFLKGIEDEEEIVNIENILNNLSSLGYQIFVKKHPRQPNKLIFKNNMFNELPRFDNDMKILFQFDFIIAQYSTLLFQCYCAQQSVLVDDVSNLRQSNALRDREYFFYGDKLKGQGLLLSEFLYEKEN